jgi:hypothetical protein
MIKLMNFIQESSPVGVDTLTQSYSDKWEGTQGIEQSSEFMQFMASGDLIFVVLGVSLIIWFVLLFYIIKVDRNLSKIEESLNSSDEA